MQSLEVLNAHMMHEEFFQYSTKAECASLSFRILCSHKETECLFITFYADFSVLQRGLSFCNKQYNIHTRMCHGDTSQKHGFSCQSKLSINTHNTCSYIITDQHDEVKDSRVIDINLAPDKHLHSSLTLWTDPKSISDVQVRRKSNSNSL